MPWPKISPFNMSPEDVAIRKCQIEKVADLRRRRTDQAQEQLKALLRDGMPLNDLLREWERVCEEQTDPWRRGRGDRWVWRMLRKLGWKVAGKVRTGERVPVMREVIQRDGSKVMVRARNSSGMVLYEDSRDVDERIIHAPAGW